MIRYVDRNMVGPRPADPVLSQDMTHDTDVGPATMPASRSPDRLEYFSASVNKISSRLESRLAAHL
jgi:hypothetical protein